MVSVASNLFQSIPQGRYPPCAEKVKVGDGKYCHLRHLVPINSATEGKGKSHGKTDWIRGLMKGDPSNESKMDQQSSQYLCLFMICCQCCHYSDSSSIERKLPTTVSRADNTGDELERPLSEGIPSGNQACFAQKFPNLKSVFPISTLPITVEFPISSYDFLVIFPYFP